MGNAAEPPGDQRSVPPIPPYATCPVGPTHVTVFPSIPFFLVSISSPNRATAQAGCRAAVALPRATANPAARRAGPPRKPRAGAADPACRPNFLHSVPLRLLPCIPNYGGVPRLHLHPRRPAASRDHLHAILLCGATAANPTAAAAPPPAATPSSASCLERPLRTAAAALP